MAREVPVLHRVRRAARAAQRHRVRVRQRSRVLERTARERLRRGTARRGRSCWPGASNEPRKGKYVLPGGFVEFDETP